MNNRAGTYKNNLSGEMAYKSFMPASLPPKPPIELTNEIVEILVKANKQLALLEGIASRIPNMNLFISMYVRKEALMSSQIEGTQATLEDVLDPNLEENTNRPVGDVVNYIKATDYAINRLKELPLCNRLIKEAHEVLLQGVRGQNKSPGEFRHSQNWIGAAGCNLLNARYVPPSVEDMKQAMSDLEKYINEDDTLDVLIRAGLIHYQFETIHPFLDGNGRIGRLLITLFLMEKKVLTTPALYISYFLKKNRIEYYDRMNEVRLKGNYEQWIKFFLEAVYESAKDATETIDKLVALHDKNCAKVEKLGRRAKNAIRVFEYLESNPIIEIQKTCKELGIAFNTMSSIVKDLTSIGVLVQTSTQSRNRTFAYREYLEILKEGTN
ncbi:MAG: Fic family protein [Candidatus Gastranaerophilales bacterium]|nr:Fic family protein [Candidatus Gastranaerophilales bacterium]MCM1072429.1 Fic family protein [Bacteroides sp.]